MNVTDKILLKDRVINVVNARITDTDTVKVCTVDLHG